MEEYCVKRFMRVFAVLATLALVLAACGDDGAGDTTTTAGGATTTAGGDTTTTGGEPTTTAAELIGEGRTIGMAFDVGGRGDLSFNDLAALAWDDGMAMYGYTGEELAPDAGGENREENLRLLAESGQELIIANGFAFAQNVWRVGTEFPDTMFAITDDCPQDDTFTVVEMANVRCMLFSEEQGSFLMGVAAAMKSTTGTIGFIGGVQVPLILKFQAGFEAGALAANPDINILPAVYLTQVPDFTGFNDPVKGKEAALALYGQGADVIFHAAGGSGLGLFQAADELSTDESFLWAIGVDSDQYNTVGDPALQEHILTSMLKRVDVAVGKAILDFLEGNFTPGPVRLGLAEEGVGYATSGGFVDDIAADLDEYAAQIIDGTIVVPTEPEA
ncbi:MAG TPA: BMP family ABC transporter substrate-binding protein [Acidimicrobiia bacterium]|nr:BMP family ABC transporter substrate-binding protein [Acidimicrobiia bacterium]